MVDRDPTVDVFRGIAILMILILHAVVMTPGVEGIGWLVMAANRLGSGVQFFFVLSGFVIASAYDRSRLRPRPVTDFLVRRVAKILPLYLLYLHANIAFFWLVDSYQEPPQLFRNSVTGANLTPGNYAAHLLFLQMFVPSTLHSLADGSWSVACEIVFYALYPVAIARFSKVPQAAMYCYVASLVAAALFVIGVGHSPSHYYGYYGFPAQLPCFLLGVYVFRLRQSNPEFELPEPHMRALALFALVVFVGTIKAESLPLGFHHALALLFAVSLFFIRIRSDRLPARVLRLLGRQSYALFFGHLFLLKATFALFTVPFAWLGVSTLLAINLWTAVALAFALSAVLLHPFDQWFVNRISRWLDQRACLETAPSCPPRLDR